jgi:hypothetical protein
MDSAKSICAWCGLEALALCTVQFSKNGSSGNWGEHRIVVAHRGGYYVKTSEVFGTGVYYK